MTVNITNPPIDRRRLSVEDREVYNRSGSHARAKKAVARTRAYRGDQRYQRNRMENTEGGRNTNSFFGGRQIQQARLREVGQERRRAESFRPTMVKGDSGTTRSQVQQGASYFNYRDRNNAI